MTLSQGFIRHLQSDTSDEPLPKRLKLAENVLYSPDLPIAHKENCILKWLCSELSDENASTVWTTIHRCLSVEPKTYAKLFPETKGLLIEKLIENFNQYPESYVSEEIIKCCPYVISNSHISSCSKDNSVIQLIKALIEFMLKVLDADNFEKENSFRISVLIECTEQAIAAFVQVCRQSSSEKKNFTLIFIEELFFPLAYLNEKLKVKQVSSKISIETEKCVRRLLLPSIKNASAVDTKDESNEKTEETEYVFSALKESVEVKKFEEVKAAFNCLFQCAVSSFSQNSVLVDIIMRRLVDCIDQKDHSQQILILLLESSIDISHNFEHEIEGVTLKAYLKTQIEEILSKRKHLKHSDYNLLAAIAKLNPLIIEDVTQSILERIIFENKKHKKEEVAYEKLFTELWKASVRLRRQQKFLSKLLITVVNFKEEKDSFFIDKFDLPDTFIYGFKEDLKSKTTSAQVIGMFHTLNFHLQSDCNKVLKESGPSTQVYLLMKVISRIFVTYFENSSFLDNSLPLEWQQKFHKAFSDLRDNLASLAEALCNHSYEAVIFIAYFNLIKIWCEVHDLLQYYMPDLFSTKLIFPIDESQIKELKKVVKKLERSEDCQKFLNEVLYVNTTICNRENQEPIKDKILLQLWPGILENTFHHIETMSELQVFQLAEHLTQEVSSDENEFTKWNRLLKLNTPRISITFATAVALQIISNIASCIESSTTKTIIESTDFEKVLQSSSDSDQFKKILKSIKKEIAKQNFNSIPVCDVDKIRRNLLFLSSLPISFLDQNIRLLLFMVLYTFDQETKQRADFKELIHNLYCDFLRQNDIDVISSVSNPNILVEHFQENNVLITKIIKLSLNDPTTLTFWESFIEKEECNRKISSVLLICIDNLKSKASHENKTSLQSLAQSLSRKFVKSLEEQMNDCFEIAGLRISLKTVLAEKKKVKSNLKKCVESTFHNLIESKSTTLNEELAQETIQLSLIVLSHREHFNVDNGDIKKICEIFITNPYEKTFSHFLEILKDNEFVFFAEALTSQTGDNLINGKIEALDKIVTVWQSLAKIEAKASRSKSLCLSLNNLLNNLIASEIKDISCLPLFRIFRAFVTSKRLIRLSEIIIDSIFVVSMECLDRLDQQTIFACCQEALGLCLDFIRSKTEFVLDRLPVLNCLFKKVFQVILKEAKATSFSDEQILRILAIDIEKFCTFYAKLKKDVARISPYLIADLIDISSRIGVLPSYLKVSIDSAISQLLTNCDRHAVSFLSRTLPTSTQQIFKTIYDNYVKYHKFTGKI